MIIGSVSMVLMTSIMVTRIWRLSKRSWWTVAFIAMVIVLNMCAFATSAAVTVLSQIVFTYTEFHEKYSWLWYVCFGSRAVIDFFVAVILGFLLSKYRTKIRRTNRIVNLLILYCVNTGAITSATSIAVIITFATLPASFITFSFTVLLPKFMLNSLLSLLNSRQLLRDKGKAEVVSIHLSRITSSSRMPSTRTPNAMTERRMREEDVPSGSLDSEVKPTSSGAVLVIA
ncbi:hypothetical protein PHLGIDRAFT_486737 [Phlebiopsis gigantea 11061_1 CR5-6]|uniref:DUF6534 domain-containing protein n=1 Tax=Phlebiopsis gigantea (strain 11061_1 CR5-6) TaxID=745531 RepID=A0A0C3RW58_PHLG1|nr:hypothetical protein PHLGIDRAFT_486737 [Phlebiopsis gigantea 11061_1 CR5-6]